LYNSRAQSRRFQQSRGAFRYGDSGKAVCVAATKRRALQGVQGGDCHNLGGQFAAEESTVRALARLLRLLRDREMFLAGDWADRRSISRSRDREIASGKGFSIGIDPCFKLARSSLADPKRSLFSTFQQQSVKAQE